jgi:hypothetical protein
MVDSPSLPNAPMTRWVAFIQLFSFDIVHKPGKIFTLREGLSRRPVDSEEEDKLAMDFDEEEPTIKACLGFRTFSLEGEELLEWEQEGYWIDMKSYLTTFKKPESLEPVEFTKLKKKSVKFYVQQGKLM